MATGSRNGHDWTSGASPSLLLAASDGRDWAVVGQPEVHGLTSQSPVTPPYWEQMLEVQTGTGSSNRSAEDAVTDSNANWAKQHQDDDALRSSSYVVVDRRPPEMMSLAVATGRVFTDADYQVLRRHVLQGDIDEHVTANDRKSQSLDGRE